MLNVFISDLGRYDTGELTGKWHDMETEDGRQSAKDAIIEIGSAGDYFISDYESDFLNIGEFANINDLLKIGEIFEMDPPDLVQMALEVTHHNGEYDHLNFYDMEYFDDVMSAPDINGNIRSPLDIANCIHFGEFNPTHDYFRLDAYANVLSVNQWEYEAMHRDEAENIVASWLSITHGIEI